jgi:diaminopimelate epimerase
LTAGAALPFAKYHALGNDYAVVERAALGCEPAPEWVRCVCDRHRGLGADGVLLREPGPPHRVRIFNPDGSEAEKSGNGLRIFARYLFDRGAVSGERFAVATAGGRVHCQVREGGRSVSVEMGRVSFASPEIPVAGPPREVLREPAEIAGVALELSAATLGNPHCVVLREAVSAEEARALGPLLERDPRFPRRTNVQFVQVLDASRLRVEIWERGAGYTLASGSSACAAAAVAHRLGFCGPHVQVEMPGGALAIELSPSFEARMTGGVTRVAEGVLSAEAFEDALASGAQGDAL